MTTTKRHILIQGVPFLICPLNRTNKSADIADMGRIQGLNSNAYYSAITLINFSANADNDASVMISILF